jgi:hypothetical protein
MARISLVVLATAAFLLPLGCRDVSGFNTGSDSYVGQVVQADFVRAGVGEDVQLCLTLDTDHLQDAPGTISTSDGVFAATPMRPIPQIWHDPLSTFNFGDGRIKNLLYVATASADGGSGGDMFVVVSLMNSGKIEVRLLQGAPSVAGPGSDSGPTSPPTAPPSSNVFAVFSLSRQASACSF